MTAAFTIASLFIVFLACWFWYSCTLILRNRTSQNFASYAAELNGLKFVEVNRTLADGSALHDLSSARKLLVDDYQFVTYLIFHASQYEAQERLLETRMLMVYFGVLRLLSRLCSMLPKRLMLKALEEMTSVIVYLANGMGERAACSTQP